jgi:hypothetical protein
MQYYMYIDGLFAGNVGLCNRKFRFDLLFKVTVVKVQNFTISRHISFWPILTVCEYVSSRYRLHLYQIPTRSDVRWPSWKTYFCMYLPGADPGFFAGRGPPLGADPEIWLGVWQCADRRVAPMRAAAGALDLPQEKFKSRCSGMQFQANPDGTILPQKLLLSCYVRDRLPLLYTWKFDSLLNYFEIRD